MIGLPADDFPSYGCSILWWLDLSLLLNFSLLYFHFCALTFYALILSAFGFILSIFDGL